MDLRRFLTRTLVAVCVAVAGAFSVSAQTTSAPMPATRQVRDAAAGSQAPGAHLDYEPGKTPKYWAVAAADTIMARWPDYTKAYFAPWTYVHGYALCAFDRLSRSTGNPSYYDYLKAYVDKFVDEQGNFRPVAGRGQPQTVRFDNLDNIMTGTALVIAYEHTHDERYRKAAEAIRGVFDTYPRNSYGGFWHNRSMQGQMWIDGIFMGQMFLTRYGKSIGDAAYCWDEATKQMTVYASRAERDQTGLYIHAIYEPGHTARGPAWADPQTGRSPEVWSEGLGWYALVMAETLADMPKDGPRRTEMEDIFRRLAAGLKKTQDPKSGCWFQVVDKGMLPDNWTDTSGSAMFTYAIARGMEIGLLDSATYRPVVEAGYQGITSFAKVNSQGLVDVYSACDGVGVQTSYARYINYQKSINAKEAFIGFLWATEIVERPRLTGGM
jgi:unsaturated rhamnogalacturonyl hydrolase